MFFQEFVLVLILHVYSLLRSSSKVLVNSPCMYATLHYITFQVTFREWDLLLYSGDLSLEKQFFSFLFIVVYRHRDLNLRFSRKYGLQVQDANHKTTKAVRSSVHPVVKLVSVTRVRYKS